MLNIAFILTSTAFGGAEKVGLTLLKHINSERFRLFPIALVRPWEESNPFVTAVEAIGLRCDTIPVAKRPRAQGRDYLRVLRCFERCRALLKHQRIDLVHANGYFADLIGIPAAGSLNIPSLSTCHGFIAGDPKLKLYNWLDKKMLRFANRIIAVSENIREALIRAGVHKKRIVMVPNAVEKTVLDRGFLLQRKQLRRHFHLTDQEIVLGYSGRLSEEKGVLYLIETVRRLVMDGLPTKLLIVGDGPQRRLLESMIEQYALSEHCVLTGFQLQAERFLAAMDIFVLPSLSEGTPMALLEAMAAGVPVIASAVGGIPDIIVHKHNGILVAPAQTEHIQSAVKELRENPFYGRNMALEAQKTIQKRFGIQHWIRQYEGIYNDLITRNLRRYTHALHLQK